jgi:uncharacterized membrane protein YcaP (DUF421 family)
MDKLIGTDGDLSLLQMSVRAVIAFISALIIIRFSGKRSFGMRSPLDNVISILLGTLFGSAIIGKSPFFSTIFICLLLAALFRFCAWLCVKSHAIGKILKGDKTVIFENGKMNYQNMNKCQVTEQDLLEEIRVNAGIDSTKEVDKAFVERNGTISIVKK